jgi:hypothetical protein
VSVLAGATAPERYRITVENAEIASEPLDLTTVTEAVMRVTKPSGEIVEWAATIEEQGATALVIEHVFDAFDVEQTGTYPVTVIMTVPGGTRRAGPTSLVVI